MAAAEAGHRAQRAAAAVEAVTAVTPTMSQIIYTTEYAAARRVCWNAFLGDGFFFFRWWMLETNSVKKTSARENVFFFAHMSLNMCMHMHMSRLELAFEPRGARAASRSCAHVAEMVNWTLL